MRNLPILHLFFLVTGCLEGIQWCLRLVHGLRLGPMDICTYVLWYTKLQLPGFRNHCSWELWVPKPGTEWVQGRVQYICETKQLDLCDNYVTIAFKLFCLCYQWKWISFFLIQWYTSSVADPGFPRGATSTPKGDTNLLFGQIFLKTEIK